ncbi:MAG: hypothetical protein J2P41_02780, partial [Blastocatellia bacterium]|nr:hypothetical protein [Blastocatellia bacterium]
TVVPVTNGVAINVTDTLESGGSTNSSNGRTDTAEWQDSLTMTQKKHTIKVGFQVEDEFYYNMTRTNFNGTYTFSTLDQYVSALAGLAPATQYTVNTGDPKLRYSQYEASWYVNDDIRMKQSLTISLGLRHEFQQHLQDKLNLAPRFSIAWMPFKSRKSVIRAGGGVFFSRLTAGSYANTLRYNNDTQQTYTIPDPMFQPVPLPLDQLTLAQRRNTTIQQLDPNLKAPYNISNMLSFEQQLPKALVATVSYNINRGLHLFETRNINAPLPGTGQRPDPTRGNIYNLESDGKSIRNEISFGLSRRFSTRFLFFTTYRLAWAKDDVAFPADSYNLMAEWARSSGDRRHQFNTFFIINLPWGIRLSPQMNINSGTPFNITTGLDDNHDTQFTDRPAGIGRNADLPASLYPLIPMPDRVVLLANGSSMSLINYLNTFFPNGLKAESPGSFNANFGISKTFSFGTRSNQLARNRQDSGDLGIPGADGGGIGQGGGGRGGQGGGGRGGFGGGGGGRGGFGGGGGGGRGGFGGRRGGGDENALYTLRFGANFTNIFNHVNYGPFSGTLGSPYLGFPSYASSPRQLNFNLAVTF